LAVPIQLAIKDIREEYPGFRTITFEDGHGIDYRAGQYLTLVHRIGGSEIRRSYSITSSPVLKEPLSIGVKRVENGIVSRLLVDSAAPGDCWKSIGAGGLFTFPENMAAFTQVVFLAAGSGITPVLSLLKTALVSFPTNKLLLVYSNATASKTAYRNELNELQLLHPGRLDIRWLYSDNPDLSRARLHRDLLRQLVNETRTALEHLLFYTCGPESYMRLCMFTLQEMGVPGKNIRRENFVIHALPAHIHVFKSGKGGNVQLRSRDGVIDFAVGAGETILRAAKRQGIALPYSCEAGSCGQCALRCTEGKVQHANNEVLTDADLAMGLVLTCTGYPDGDVVLES
jgi:ring-1,2-phenylacetyl-CoA epoxidase subunit PaaE